MCGILYAKRKDKFPVNKSLLKRYRNQRNRGTKGFGFIAIENGKVVGVERFEKEADAEKAIENNKSNEVMFHHRFPTSTPNYEDMTHPIVVKNKELDNNYYVIHNGVLRNENILKTKHETLGYEYTTMLQEITVVKTKKRKKETMVESFNDSEAFAIELARYLDGKSTAIGAIGTIAFICFETDKKDRVLRIHYGRNTGNPLKVEKNGDLFFIKSEGDGEVVDPHILHSIDYKTNVLSSRRVDIGHVDYREYNNQTLDWHSQSNPRTIGFGADDERESPKGILSPIQQRHLLPSGWDADGDLKDIPVVDDMDFDEQYRNYQKSEAYLYDLHEEIDSLKADIATCKKQMENPTRLKPEELTYYQEYMSECEDNMKEKEKRARDLEDCLASNGH